MLWMKQLHARAKLSACAPAEQQQCVLASDLLPLHLPVNFHWFLWGGDPLSPSASSAASRQMKQGRSYQRSTRPAHSPGQQWKFVLFWSRFWKVMTDGRTCVNNIGITTGRDCDRPRGSKGGVGRENSLKYKKKTVDSRKRMVAIRRSCFKNGVVIPSKKTGDDWVLRVKLEISYDSYSISRKNTHSIPVEGRKNRHHSRK